jgi:adenosylmethionine-8-amino-7-oxononanoate aminotransferase
VAREIKRKEGPAVNRKQVSAHALDAEALRQAALDHLWMPFAHSQSYAELGGPPILVSGEGVRVKGIDGKTYLDGIGALEACAVGHHRRELIDAAIEQYQQLEFVDTFRWASVPAIKLAERIAHLAPGSLNKVFYSPGGSEAVETAIKIARQFHFLNGDPHRSKVISRYGAFHGVTYGVMAVDGQYSGTRNYMFEPLPAFGRFVQPPYHYRCRFCSDKPACTLDCARDIEYVIQHERPETVSAVIMDPVNVAIGVAIPPPEYLPMVRETCARYGVLLIADEVISGFGRTGRMFCCENWGVVPDIMTLSKAITSGYVPLGATVVRQEIADKFVGGDETIFRHGQTFGGHPVACAVALKNIEIIEREDLPGRAAELGPYLLAGLQSLSDHPSVGEARGLGLVGGLEVVLDKKTRALTPALGLALRQITRKNGLITLSVYPGNVMFVTPPLTITREEIKEMIDIFDKSLTEMEEQFGIRA